MQNAGHNQHTVGTEHLKQNRYMSMLAQHISMCSKKGLQTTGLKKKKGPSGCLGQVDFPAGQATFHSHLPNGQGPRQVICQLNHKKSNLRLAQGKQNLRATCPKGKLEFNLFSSPD